MSSELKLDPPSIHSSSSHDLNEYKNDEYPFMSISRIKIEDSNVSDKVIDNEVYRSLLCVGDKEVDDHGKNAVVSSGRSPYRPSSPCHSPEVGHFGEIENGIPTVPFLTATTQNNDANENSNEGDEPLDALATLIAQHCAKNPDQEVTFTPGSTSILPNSALRIPAMQDEISDFTPATFFQKLVSGIGSAVSLQSDDGSATTITTLRQSEPESAVQQSREEENSRLLLSIEEGELMEEFGEPMIESAIEEEGECHTAETEDMTEVGGQETGDPPHLFTWLEYYPAIIVRMVSVLAIFAASLATADVISLKFLHQCVAEEEQQSFKDLGFLKQIAVCIFSDDSRDLLVFFAVAAPLVFVLVFFRLWFRKVKVKKPPHFLSIGSCVKIYIFITVLFTIILTSHIIMLFVIFGWAISCIVEVKEVTKSERNISHSYYLAAMILLVRTGVPLILALTGSPVLGWFGFIVWAAIWAIVSVLPPFTYQYSTMCPIIEVNDCLVLDKITKLFRPFKRNDVVLFRVHQSVLPLRIVAIENFEVKCDDNKIRFNNVEQGRGKLWVEQNQHGTAMRKGHVCAVDDNPERGFDECHFFILPTKSIIGRAVFRIWPLHRIGNQGLCQLNDWGIQSEAERRGVEADAERRGLEASATFYRQKQAFVSIAAEKKYEDRWCGGTISQVDSMLSKEISFDISQDVISSSVSNRFDVT